MGLRYLLADSNSNFVLPPKFLRSSEKRLKRLQRRVSKKYDKQRKKNKQRQSNNYHKARIKLARANLKVSRQRKDFAILCVIRYTQRIYSKALAAQMCYTT